MMTARVPESEVLIDEEEVVVEVTRDPVDRSISFVIQRPSRLTPVQGIGAAVVFSSVAALLAAMLVSANPGQSSWWFIVLVPPVVAYLLSQPRRTSGQVNSPILIRSQKNSGVASISGHYSFTAASSILEQPHLKIMFDHIAPIASEMGFVVMDEAWGDVRYPVIRDVDRFLEYHVTEGVIPSQQAGAGWRCPGCTVINFDHRPICWGCEEKRSEAR